MGVRLPGSDPPPSLDRIRVRFATHRDRSADERGAFAEDLRRIATHEGVLLETCHRVELVSIDDEPEGSHSVSGAEAIRRVFNVVAGFDSAVVAEEQLLGQVRRAYERALATGSTGPVLNELFRRAIRFGRRVRSHARPGVDRSLAEVGAGWLLQRLPDAPAATLVAGTGEMARLAAAAIARGGHRVTVASASALRAQRVIDRLPGSGHAVTTLPFRSASLAGVAGIVMAQRPGAPVTDAAAFGGKRPWTVDLSNPTRLAPDALEHLGDRLLAIDALGAVEGRAPALDPATEQRLRAEIGDEVSGFAIWLQARRGARAIATLHDRAHAVRRRHVDRLRRHSRLEPDQLEAVEATTSAIVGELLHGPSLELRRGGIDAETVRRLFDVEA